MQLTESTYKVQTDSLTHAQMQLWLPACLVYVLKGPQNHSLFSVHPASRPNELCVYLPLAAEDEEGGLTTPSCTDRKLEKALCVTHSGLKPQHVAVTSVCLEPFHLWACS